ncbi:MAG TPA: BMP family protein [Fimbriimonadaceae bacterium]|nr:BMP family protein [Fimbriimonadaceae bacterium]HRJ96065.1 BMP family protein [Fimbriimonadaceae bacterium]
MRSRWILPVVAAIAALVAGCSGGQREADGTKVATEPGKGPLKVALLTPGPVSDSGWSALAFEGLKAIESELGAEVANQEATGSKIKDAMRAYAGDGYRLVIGHGYEYNEPGVEVAADFPNTVFVSSSGDKTAANAGAFRFYLEQGFYLAGMMAGSMSKSGTVAMIGGPNVPSIVSTFKAFRAGAEAAKPGIKVIETFTGSNDDVAAAKKATETAIGQGADFVIHQANAGAQGVFNACKEKGVFAFGANEDQNANPSGMVIASAIIVARPAFINLAKQVKEGRYKGHVELMGMEDGAIEFVVNPDLSAKVPADVLAKIEAARSDIKLGKLVVPKDEF